MEIEPYQEWFRMWLWSLLKAFLCSFWNIYTNFDRNQVVRSYHTQTGNHYFYLFRTRFRVLRSVSDKISWKVYVSSLTFTSYSVFCQPTKESLGWMIISTTSSSGTPFSKEVLVIFNSQAFFSPTKTLLIHFEHESRAKIDDCGLLMNVVKTTGHNESATFSQKPIVENILMVLTLSYGSKITFSGFICNGLS